MALFSRKRILLAKLEEFDSTNPSTTGYGKSEALDGSDAILVRSLDITPIESDVVSRDLIRPYYGTSDQLLANTRVTCTFEVELAGSGNSSNLVPRYDSVLRACGMNRVSGTTSATSNGVTDATATAEIYSPISTFDNVDGQGNSVTLIYNLDGVQHKVVGARGTVTVQAQVGQLPVLQFQLTGIYSNPTDVSAATPVYAAQADPLIFKQGNTSDFSFFGFSDAKLSSLTLNVANQIVYRELIGTDSKEVLITDRAPSGDVVIEAVKTSSKNFFETALGSSTGVLKFQHGQTPGNRVQLAANRCDIGNPSYSDEDGITMLNLPYVALPSSSGNDDFELIYS